jgi:hypothetical protein
LKRGDIIAAITREKQLKEVATRMEDCTDPVSQPEWRDLYDDFTA